MSKRNEIENLQFAFALHRSGRLAEAAKAYRKVIKRDPKQPHALHSLGIIESANGNYREAAQLMARSLSAEPTNLDFMQNYATVLCQLGQFETAHQMCARGLAINGSHVYLLYVLGGTLLKLGRLQESLAAYDRLLRIEPNHIAAITERSSVMIETKQYDAAAADIERALALDPNYADAHANRGLLYVQLKQYDQAVAAYGRASELKPESAEIWTSRGNAFAQILQYDAARTAHEKALSLRPDLTRAWLGFASVMSALNRPAEALSAYDRALKLEPDSVEVQRDLAYYLTNLGRHEDAAVAYDKLHSLKPDLTSLAGLRLLAKLHCCDWRDFSSDCTKLIRAIEADKDVVLPFDCLAIPSSLDVRLKCSQSWVNRNFATNSQALWYGSAYRHDKVRLGYVSADFRRHPTAFLTAGLFEGHDRSRFDVLGLSIGPNDGSEMRARLEGAFDKFIDCAGLTDDAVAERVRAEEIDILVDLNGFTIHARTGIFARRPAPIQLNYLGFPGTMGADFFDYIVADSVVIPPSHQYGYSEKIVYLPHCYQPNDRERHIAERQFTREECALPEKGFVFCCFNNNFKIMPAVFDSWMRILDRTEGSVLWLLKENRLSAENLKRHAAERGIDPSRLIFAERMKLSDHLARHRLADLFLDTLPYNAHTTGSDALWAGLPILTCIGESFASRVAASLLTAVGLPELIADSAEQFESLAIELAAAPSRLATIKDKLARNRLATPLFDTKLYIGNLEAAYEVMHRRSRDGFRPEHIHVAG
jgi:predicted O-linked N-acetylglucosamine transferase (SPINDLY family)